MTAGWLPCLRGCCDHFAHGNFLKALPQPSEICYHPHFAKEEPGTETLGDLPKVTGMIHGGAERQTLAFWPQSPHASPSPSLSPIKESDPPICHRAQVFCAPKFPPRSLFPSWITCKCSLAFLTALHEGAGYAVSTWTLLLHCTVLPKGPPNPGTSLLLNPVEGQLLLFSSWTLGCTCHSLAPPHTSDGSCTVSALGRFSLCPGFKTEARSSHLRHHDTAPLRSPQMSSCIS